MDTDSNYIAISGERLEGIVRPELKPEFEAQKKQWLAWEGWSGRTPGLFKLEYEGSWMMALSSKCYFMDDQGKKKKFSTKGMLKKQNELTWHRTETALQGKKDMEKNRGFKMHDRDKRWVLPDGIHTEPIEFHI